MGLFDGNNNFSVLDGYGMNTLAFVINTAQDENQEVHTIEKMKCFMEAAENGYKKTFYFNEELTQDVTKELVFLTLKPGQAVLNAGEYANGQLTIGRKPETVKYSSVRTSGDEAEYKEFKYAPNFKRPISIIDPEIGDELKPILYFDQEANDVKAKVKLLPNKSYIFLEVRSE